MPINSRVSQKLGSPRLVRHSQNENQNENLNEGRRRRDGDMTHVTTSRVCLLFNTCQVPRGAVWWQGGRPTQRAPLGLATRTPGPACLPERWELATKLAVSWGRACCRWWVGSRNAPDDARQRRSEALLGSLRILSQQPTGIAAWCSARRDGAGHEGPERVEANGEERPRGRLGGGWATGVHPLCL